MTTDSLPMPDTQDSAPALDEVAKPKRTRRTKTAEVADVTSAEVVASSGQAVETEVAKRAPRRRKPAEVVDVVSAPEAQVGEPPARKRASRRKGSVESGESGDVVVGQGLGESAPGVTMSMVPAAIGDRSSAGEGESAESSDRVMSDAGESRESRGERRDRRDRRRNRPPRPEAVSSSVGDSHNESEPFAAGVEAQADAEGGELRLNRRAAMAEQQASEVFAELLSGEFDKVHEEESEGEEPDSAGPYKRVLRPEPDAPKLQKVLAQSGVGSRRDIEKMIEEGRIEVNDQVAHIGQRISHGDRVKVAGKPIKVRIAPQPARILAYHKPVGEVVTHDDPQGRPTVFRRLPRLQHGKWMSVGRLDLNTEGLLLFTNSGELANQLMHPRFGVEREYAVRVLGSLDEASRERLLAGVEIEGQAAAFLSVSKGLGEGVNQWYRVVITEGRNREVRKLFDAVGLTVNRLIRVRYGAIVLPRGLRRGVWVELGESDVRAVKSLAGMNRQDQDQHQDRSGHGGGQARSQGQGQHREQQGPRGAQQGAQYAQQGRQGQRGGKQERGSGPNQGGRSQGPGAQGGQQGQRPPRSHGVDRVQQGQPDHDDDDHFGPIPNPLEQTFDRRFVKSGSKRITSGFGRPDQDQGGQQGGKQQKGPRQPDPMQTSVGYIGADAYFGGGRNNRGGGGGGGGGGRRGRR